MSDFGLSVNDLVVVSVNVFAVVILVEAILAVISVIYIARIYSASERQSRLFRMLTRADVIKVVAGVWIGGVAVSRLALYPVPLPIWTTPISAVVVIVLLSPPIYHAVTFWMLRQARKDAPPSALLDDDSEAPG